MTLAEIRFFYEGIRGHLHEISQRRAK